MTDEGVTVRFYPNRLLALLDDPHVDLRRFFSDGIPIVIGLDSLVSILT